jgi:hypothetical protein
VPPLQGKEWREGSVGARLSLVADEEEKRCRIKRKAGPPLPFASIRQICRNTGTGEVIVMEDMDDKLRLGVVLVEDIASQVADSEICQFFSHIDNVTAVSVIQADNGVSGRRFCWVSVKNPFDTVANSKVWKSRDADCRCV